MLLVWGCGTYKRINSCHLTNWSWKMIVSFWDLMHLFRGVRCSISGVFQELFKVSSFKTCILSRQSIMTSLPTSSPVKGSLGISQGFPGVLCGDGMLGCSRQERVCGPWHANLSKAYSLIPHPYSMLTSFNVLHPKIRII